METTFSISINNPCSERFSQFKRTTTGGFCNACQKEVIDFRQMSEEQIINYLKQKQDNTCGVFKSSQIQRAMETKTLKQPKFKFLKVAAVIVFSLLSLHGIQAQENTKATKTEIAQKNLLKGVISDESGPLAGANIVLQNTKVGATSDFDGKFTFPKVLKEGDVLIVSYIGYEPQKFVITKDQKFLEVALTGDDIDLMGAVEVKKVYKSKR